MSRARTFQEKGNAQKEILPKQVDFFRRLSWGMRKYRIHCHESGELSMKHQGRWDSHTVLLRSALLRFSFFLAQKASERKGNILCQRYKKLFWLVRQLLSFLC